MKSSARDNPTPVIHKEWWKQHVKYWKLDRQDLELMCGKLCMIVYILYVISHIYLYISIFLKRYLYNYNYNYIYS